MIQFDNEEMKLIEKTLYCRYCEYVEILLKAKDKFGSIDNILDEKVRATLSELNVEVTKLDKIIDKIKLVIDEENDEDEAELGSEED